MATKSLFVVKMPATIVKVVEAGDEKEAKSLAAKLVEAVLNASGGVLHATGTPTVHAVADGGKAKSKEDDDDEESEDEDEDDEESDDDSDDDEDEEEDEEDEDDEEEEDEPAPKKSKEKEKAKPDKKSDKPAGKIKIKLRG